LNTCDTASPDDVATSPISSGIQNGLFNVASAFGLNAIDDLAGDLTDAIKGNQTWSQAGRGMLNTLSDVKNNIIRSPVQGLSNGGRGLAPVVAADGQTLVVTQKAAAVPVLSNPTAVVVLMNATKTTNAANKVDDAVSTKKAIVKNKNANVMQKGIMDYTILKMVRMEKILKPVKQILIGKQQVETLSG